MANENIEDPRQYSPHWINTEAAIERVFTLTCMECPHYGRLDLDEYGCKAGLDFDTCNDYGIFYYLDELVGLDNRLRELLGDRP